MERKLARQTLSNPSSLGLEVFPAGSRDVTITLALSGVLKTTVQVQAQQAADNHTNTYSKLIYSPYRDSQMSNHSSFITYRRDGGQRRMKEVG